VPDVFVVGEQPVDTFDDARFRRGSQTPTAQSCKHFAVTSRKLRTFDHARSVKEHFERSRGRKSRVELAQAACCCIPRVHEYLFALLRRNSVHFLEAGNRNEHLASDFKHLWKGLASQAQRNRLDRADVVRDVFAHAAIAACRRDFERTLAVCQADCEAVQLRLAGIPDLALSLEALAHAPVECDDVLA
jgi:hypothetical protein